jgi:hypothetical protein
MKILSTQKIILLVIFYCAFFLFGVLMSGCAKQEPAAAPTATQTRGKSCRANQTEVHYRLQPKKI